MTKLEQLKEIKATIEKTITDYQILEQDILKKVQEAMIRFKKYKNNWVPTMTLDIMDPFFYGEDIDKKNTVVIELHNEDECFDRIAISYEKLNDDYELTKDDIITHSEIEQKREEKRRHREEKKLYEELKRKFEGA
jgi:hypothetical protein